MIVINFKNYKFGREALQLAKKIERYVKKAVVAVPAAEIKTISDKAKLKVYAQHVDYHKAGRATGFIVPEDLKKDGAVGSLLNHSEHRVGFGVIKKTLERCNKVGLKLIICVASLQEARKVRELKPYAIAFEDPKLVGSGKSITEHRGEDVARFVKILGKSKIIPLCGAGISDIDDIKKAYELGCKGILIASAIANSKNPGRLLGEISKLRK